MSDIFISYSQEDRPRARIIAAALEQHGWTVWWDRKIPVGKSFEEVIEKEILAAKCVMVLWSKFSVKSRWVKEEANEGQGRSILAPVLIDEVSIPLGFRSLQAANLVNWAGDAFQEDFTLLVTDVSQIIGIVQDSIPPAKTESITNEQKDLDHLHKVILDNKDQKAQSKQTRPPKKNHLPDASESKVVDPSLKEAQVDQISQMINPSQYESNIPDVTWLSFSEVYCKKWTNRGMPSVEEGQLTISSQALHYKSVSEQFNLTDINRIYYQPITSGFMYNSMVVEFIQDKVEIKLLFCIYSFWSNEPTRKMFNEIFNLHKQGKLKFIHKMVA